MKALAVLLALVAFGAHAAPKRLVLIVANNQSLGGSEKNLRYADDDGLLYQALFAPYAHASRLLTVLDDETQARFPKAAEGIAPPTLENVQSALKGLFAEATVLSGRGETSELYFVFIGHGDVDENASGYVHLQDGRFTRAQLFSEVIAASTAGTTHVIIDACHATSLVAGRGDEPEARARREALKRFLAGDDLERYPSVGVLVATTPDQKTHEWSRIRAGVFSFLVRSALSGAADVNRDGRLEYSEVAAFVDAAGQGIVDPSHRVVTTAWPPKQNRRQPLLDLRDATDLRPVVLGPLLSGRVAVELDDGTLWAELNKLPDESRLLGLPLGRAFFVRSDERERAYSAGRGPLFVDEPPKAELRSASRGPVEVALEQGLFAIPLSPAYYQGFVSARPELPPVSEVSAPFLPSRESASSSVSLSLGYALGASPLSGDALEHGVQLGASWRRWTWVSLIAGIDVAGSGLPGGAHTGFRTSLLAGAQTGSPLTSWLEWRASLALGWSVLQVLGPRGSVDPFVPSLGAEAGFDVRLTESLALRVGAALTGFVVTYAGRETLALQPAGRVGLSWRW